MPEILDVFLNDTTYASTSRTSEWVNVSTANSLTYSVYCSENCDLEILWSVDEDHQVIETNIYPLVGGTTVKVYTLIKFRYAQFNVTSIAANPADLKVELFFSIAT